MDRIVKNAIKECIERGENFLTPIQRRQFTVKLLPNGDGIILWQGKGTTPVPLSWDCLEEVYESLKNKGWIRIGTKFNKGSTPNSFDSFFRKFTKTAVGSWVATVFEEAGLVEINRNRPSQITAK